ncbi:MAG: poly-gamma-glutamate hydrolase family protein [Gammaproteobacteria bacterium]
MDEYGSFADLNRVERENVDYSVRIVRRDSSSTVIVAPHGGGIEPGTSEIACKIAETDLSLAIFEGKKSKGNSRLHITSTHFDEPRCMNLVMRSGNVVAIHGERSSSKVIFLGGKDENLKARIRQALEKYEYDVREHNNPDLQGLAVNNICNRGNRGVGVQLELSSGLRRMFFESLNAEGRKKPTNELKTFAVAVREGLRDAGAL